jgi:hypothetical protein
MVDICIVGAGITGLSLLLLLHEIGGIPLSRIAIVDPHFDGGDLARRWTSVQSNTPWSKSLEALRQACPQIQLPTPFARISSEHSTPLITIAELLRVTAGPLLRSVRQVQGWATQVEYRTSDKRWSICVSGGHTPIEAKVLILAQGSEPRMMNLPIPSIPLEIALDTARLRRYIRPGQRVIVFGTMHSGTLVMQNAVDCSANVVGFYNTVQPFTWDRDGAYDGLKREAAEIADAIIARRLPVELVHVQDTAAVIRASTVADWVVYAMGFQPRRLSVKVDGSDRDCTLYNGTTGVLNDAPAAWGFGIAYPNRAPDDVHWDVSVAAFLAHMKAQLPAILRELQG